MFIVEHIILMSLIFPLFVFWFILEFMIVATVFCSFDRDKHSAIAQW